MMNPLDRFLDSTTMYKVVSYSLFVLIGESVLFSFFGVLQYSIPSLLASFVVIVATALLTHFLFKKIYRAPANIESTYISAFIAFLVLSPSTLPSDLLWSMGAVSLIATSKYLIARSHRHIFNPIAFGIFVIGVLGSPSVTWWVGSQYFLPSLLVIGFLIIRKLRREVLFFGFCLSSISTMFLLSLYRHESFLGMVTERVLSWPIVFLAVFMLTEPLTTPPTKRLQGVYGALVGVLSSLSFSLPPLYSTPELALLLGNVFSYIVSTKVRMSLLLLEKKEIAKNVYEFVFRPSHRVSYQSGQYMEWTLPHKKEDTRGIRRYFTIASSPLEDVVRLGVRSAEEGSTFKKKLFTLKEGEPLLATSVMGDFLLPKDKNTKLVFIAGGIGITPYISMMRTLLLRKEKRNIVLLYANKTEEEIAYKDVLSDAKDVGVSTVHILSDKEHLPPHWDGEVGFITKEMIEKHVEDFALRTYYISGPPQMVASYKAMLKGMGISSCDIHTDFFPGFN